MHVIGRFLTAATDQNEKSCFVSKYKSDQKNLLPFNMFGKDKELSSLRKQSFRYLNKIAHWADEFPTDAFEEMLAIICKCRSSKK